MITMIFLFGMLAGIAATIVGGCGEEFHWDVVITGIIVTVSCALWLAAIYG